MRGISIVVIGLWIWIVASAMAEEIPKLPDGAKELKGADITALYDGSIVKWVNLSANGTGIALYDLKGQKQHVIYDFGDKKGTFSGKIRVKGDNFCYTPPKVKEVCVIVFTDGDDIYEVDKDHVVLSKNRKIP